MKKRRIIGGILSLCIAASMWPSPLTAAAADSDTAIYVDYEAEYTPEDDIEITAQVERADTEQVLLWYRPCEEFVWKSMAMTGTAENGYSAVVARNSALEHHPGILCDGRICGRQLREQQRFPLQCGQRLGLPESSLPADYGARPGHSGCGRPRAKTKMPMNTLSSSTTMQRISI